MKIGIPKEIKNNENRVGMTPSSIVELISASHRVFVQSQAGAGSGFTDDDYRQVGAIILDTIQEIYESSEMIVKVKEPLEQEYELIQKNQIIFTYFHFASCKSLLDAMVKSEAVCMAYETVEDQHGQLPLLVPMSEVAGRMSVQQGAKYLEKPFQGKGVLLGGVSGVRPANVVILGGGVVGTEAAKIASGMGAMVYILDINLNRLKYLSEILPKNVVTLFSNQHNIESLIGTADLIIGAVLIPGGKAPKLITKPMLKQMQKGTVLIDVAVDQGGCIETCKPTTHQSPTFVVDDIVHYCVANMPGVVPYTSTVALNNITLHYIKQIANKGWEKACRENSSLKKGVNVVNGKIVYKAIADDFGLPFHNLNL